jgi:RHS repeat-associated protein
VNGGTTEQFVYLDAGPIAQIGPSGEVAKRFVYATGQFAPDYMIAADRTYRIVVDHSGSPRLVIDVETGEIAQRLDFGPFGRTVRDSASGFQPFGFAGGVADTHTGLVHFATGTYDPTTGRWTSTASLFPVLYETNPYTFGNNDPVNGSSLV